LAEDLRKKGYIVNVAQSRSQADKTLFKVRVGSYKSKSEAESVAKILSKEGLPTKVIP
jgi:cell division protein FtsN